MNNPTGNLEPPARLTGNECDVLGSDTLPPASGMPTLVRPTQPRKLGIQGGDGGGGGFHGRRRGSDIG